MAWLNSKLNSDGSCNDHNNNKLTAYRNIIHRLNIFFILIILYKHISRCYEQAKTYSELFSQR